MRCEIGFGDSEALLLAADRYTHILQHCLVAKIKAQKLMIPRVDTAHLTLIEKVQDVNIPILA